MADQETRPSNNSQPSLRDNIEFGGQAGLATYVAAHIFGSTSLPRETPDWLKQSVESQANFAQRVPGADTMTIGGAGGGPLDDRSREERQADKDANAAEYVSFMLEETERREQERAQWAAQSHSLAGVEMTGAEWQELGGELRQDGELRQWLISRLMKDGKNRQQAERKADEIADIADIMGKPESERTEAERRKIERAEQDPDLQTVLPELAAAKRKLEAGQSIDAADSGPPAAVTTDAQLFASAPALTDHHIAAMTATAPLDQRSIPPSPQQIASAPSSGLEI